MTSLRVVPDVDFPIDAVTQKFAWLGRSGSGKSFGARRFVEQMLLAGAQVLIVDSVGVHYGIRLGTGGFSVPVLGGLFGDIPLESTAGAIVAEAIVETGSSMVLDTSQMNDAERARFMAALGKRLFELKKASPGAIHIVLDEAQDFIPQNPNPGEQQVLHEWVRIAKQGRVFGIGLSFVSQRPQELAKKALNQVECVVAFQLTGPHERKALEYWLSDKGLETKLSTSLPKLEQGCPFVWSPQWLKIAKICQRVHPIRSSDTSATPTVGDKPRDKQQMREIDLRALRVSMEQVVERAKDNDPKLLKQRIEELEKQLQAPDGSDIERLGEQTRLLEEQTRRFEEKITTLEAQTEHTKKTAHDLLHQGVGLVMDVEEKCRELHRALDTALSELDTVTSKGSSAPVSPRLSQHRNSAAVAPPVKRSASHSRLNVTASTGLGAGEDAVLKVAFQYGEQGVSAAALTVTTGYKSRSVSNYMGALTSKGLVERPEPGRVRITDKGKKLVPPEIKPLPRGKARIKHLIETLGAGESAVLACVWAQHPKIATTRGIQGALSQYSPRSISNYLVTLSSLRVIKRPGSGQVQIHPEALT